MTLLIDPPNAAGHGRMWSHLASDASFAELHGFAASLGIPRRGFDGDHYDIPAERYDAVLAAGAAPVSSRELVARLNRTGLRRRKARSSLRRAPGHPLIRSTRLRGGDRITVVAPAGPVRADRLEAGLAVLRSWELDVRLSEHAATRHPTLGYLSASDAERADDLTTAWCDPDIRAVFCARGGYGVQRMVDLLDWDAMAAAAPKVLVGFSDITALHQAFATRLGISTIHGPVVTSLGAGDDESREHLRKLLFEPGYVVSLTPSPVASLVPGRATGVLIGGNVALLATGLGAVGSMPAAASIAVLEDVGEECYRLDRLLTQLLRAGWFDGVRGIALGEFTDCGSPETVRTLVRDLLVPLGVPTICDLPVGHGPRNLAFPLGVPAVLDADAGTLTTTGATLV